MAKAIKRAALYVRVSTDHQSVENQIRELSQVAERRGWQVAEVYRDAGISGAKGRRLLVEIEIDTNRFEMLDRAKQIDQRSA